MNRYFWLPPPPPHPPIPHKTWYTFLVNSGCFLVKNVWWGVRIGNFWPKLRYFTDQNGPKSGPHENEFDYFQTQKQMLQTVRAEKVDEKNVICLVSMFSSWVMVLKLSKKMHFLQFCVDPSKKSKSVKRICIYASESSYCTLSKNNMVYGGLSHRSWDISDWNIKKDADSTEI